MGDRTAGSICGRARAVLFPVAAATCAMPPILRPELSGFLRSILVWFGRGKLAYEVAAGPVEGAAAGIAAAWRREGFVVLPG